MKDLHILSHYALMTGPDGGAFEVPCHTASSLLRVIASIGGGWDHVSVSLPHRCPNWSEMDFVKRLFFREDETAMQLHIPPEDHVNHHPNCLHLWRPHGVCIPRPPAWMVGPVNNSQQRVIP